MSRRFIDLCKDIVSDLGIAGGTINSVVGILDPEQLRIINWVARADLFVQNLWVDWKFLWYADSQVLGQAGSDIITPSLPAWAKNIQTIEVDSLWIAPGTNAARPIQYMDWETFRQAFGRKVKGTQPIPRAFSQQPDGKIVLSHNLSNDSAFALDYHAIGKRMVGDNDTSPIPENFDNIIVERAKIFYAERENAPEIMSGSTAEYTDLLDKMQAVCLPDNTAGRRLRNNANTLPAAYVE